MIYKIGLLKKYIEISNKLTERKWGSFYKILSELLKQLNTVVALLQWRLLSVRVNGLDYLLAVSGIPDLLARRALLQNAWDRVQALLEDTYPMALEVYRDENGPVFVVPDIEDLLQQAEANGKPLAELIREAFERGTTCEDSSLAIEKEVVPDLYLDSRAWRGQPARTELPPIAAHLTRLPEATADPAWLQGIWHNRHDDICTVCGLRPQGPDEKARARNMCNVCEQRRADRAREWVTQRLSTTIWLDEVADNNGRFALIAGSFDLTHWLSGQLVRTLLVRKPDDQHCEADKIAKNPSFARLRRIWETTRAFWQEVAPTDDGERLDHSVIGKIVQNTGSRLEIRGQLQPLIQDDNLPPYHTYELVIAGGVRLSVLWDGERFITCDNLDYIRRQLPSGTSLEDAARPGLVVGIEAPGGYKAATTRWGSITIASTSVLDRAFIRAIPILAEPRVFIALVPADRALEVVSAIKSKYEREMGKVRNRLPLRLGLVFAPRRAPLRAVLDAGRQMLRQHADARGWEVVCRTPKTSQDDPLPDRFASDRQRQFAGWFEVTLKRADHCLTWYVPAVMGDGQTEDVWYPYVFLDVTAEPVDRMRRFKAPNPWTGEYGWLTRVADLRPGDRIFFTPSTFDFTFLDSAARRFEVHYDNQGRRPRHTRPLLLDDLDRLEELWSIMKRLSRTQRQQVVRAIEETREMWFDEDRSGRSQADPTFKQFVADTLAGAEWPKHQPWKNLPDRQRAQLVEAAARGALSDWFELHEQILKEAQWPSGNASVTC